MRRMIWKLIRKLLFLFDAERVHLLTLSLMRMGRRIGGVPLILASGDSPSRFRRSGERPLRVLDLDFSGPVGLAAGFDKNAEVLDALPALGFDFAEIGTVTPRPQPGNERPRLFRDPSRQAVFNRMGFNGEGAEAVARRLEAIRPRLPAVFRVGVNLGKNKVTPLEEAADDYGLAARRFEGLADYLVINVSSPNTPGLRSLQTEEALFPIIDAVRDVIDRWSGVPPLLLKLAPEIQGDTLSRLISVCERRGVDGWILTNTLGGQWSRGVPEALPGGWSGEPVREHSRLALQTARRTTRKPVISVGGIMTPGEAAKRLALGADLIQLYSGWIYGGPAFPVAVRRAIEASRAGLC